MSVPDMYDEKRVLFLLSQGSEYAFTQLFDRYKSRIYGVAFRILKSPEAAEEVVQDVFLKIWMKRTQFIDIQRFDNYLFIVARNYIFDRLKKAAYEMAVKEKLPDPIHYVEDADALTRHHECQQVLEAAIAQLTDQQRKIYKLSRIEGLNYNQISEQLQLSKLTVKTHMAKALQSIRSYLVKNGAYALLFTALLDGAQN